MQPTFCSAGPCTLLLLLVAALAQKPPAPRIRTATTTGEALRTPAFAILWVSSFLCSVPLFIPFVFLPAFARDLGISLVASAALVGFIGVASVCGRLGLGALADRFGVIRLYLLCFALQAVSYAIWLGAHSYLSLIIFAVVMGTGYGGYVALAPAMMAHLFGTGRLGSLVGALYTNNAFGTLIRSQGNARTPRAPGPPQSSSRSRPRTVVAGLSVHRGRRESRRGFAVRAVIHSWR